MQFLQNIRESNSRRMAQTKPYEGSDRPQRSCSLASDKASMFYSPTRRQSVHDTIGANGRNGLIASHDFINAPRGVALHFHRMFHCNANLCWKNETQRHLGTWIPSPILLRRMPSQSAFRDDSIVAHLRLNFSSAALPES